MSGSYFTDIGVTYDSSVNESFFSTNISAGNTTYTIGGAIASSLTFLNFLTLLFFGIGLPASFPTWFIYFFVIWETTITVVTLGFIVNLLLEIISAFIP